MLNSICEICSSIIVIVVTFRIVIPVIYSVICMIRDFKKKGER